MQLHIMKIKFVRIQASFITLNCGGENFTDDKTGLRYTSDATFVGDNVNAVSKSLTPQYRNIILDTEWRTVTSFPKGIRNCYTLRPAQGKLNKYLIRARFFYGNYDGNPDKQLPQFDLHLGVEYWDTVDFNSELDTDIVDKEIIHIPSSDLVHVCLFNIGLGTPFISILELRPLNNSMYPTVSGGSLMNYLRSSDIGSTSISAATHGLRYKDDVFDRIWIPWTLDGAKAVMTTSTQNFATEENLFRMPPAVMNTGVVPSDPTQPLTFSWSTKNYSDMFYIYLSFAEIQNLKSNQTRQLNIYLNGKFYYGPVVPPNKGYTTVYSKIPYTNATRYSFSLNKTQNSTLPPIINALEVYRLKQFNDPQTNYNDVAAMFGIKSDYGVTKNWQGDPCSPVSDSWDGLKCNHTASNSPRITSMNLSASGLTGSISPHISNLTMIQLLDLSNNKLTGPIPDFLGQLPSLSVLNLSGNNFSGPVPEKLLQKSKEGNLALSIENVGSNTNICHNGSVASVLLLALAIFAILSVIKRRKQREPKQGSVESKKYDDLQTKNHRYSFAEIRDITNNFDKELGRGGFGKVYHGSIDGTQVAVKMLSSTSGQGFKEFQSEANVLMNVHHKNLTSLVGYCIEGTNIGIIYEFMANGNLHQHLSVSAENHNVLSFRDRLQIATDSAQVIAGTTGYIDPEYYISNRLTEKSDVFSFGVVILEVITGQPAIIGKPPNHAHISRWVTSTLNNGDIRDVVDPRLIGEFDVNSAWKVVELAMACVSQDPDKRPSMNKVVSELKDCLSTEMARHGTTSQRSINTLSAAPIDLEFGPMASHLKAHQIMDLWRRRSLLIAALLFLLSFTSYNFVLSQDTQAVCFRRTLFSSGFITLNCGGENFTDDDTGLRYTSDASFIADNVNAVSNIVTKGFKNITDVDRQWRSFTSFPKGIRNCYTMRPAQGKLNKYLIRARFAYGNYDFNANYKQLPQFDLHLGVEYWDTVVFDSKDDTTIVDKEIIYTPSSSDLIHVCLVNTGLGTPFIFVLELRPLNISMYPTDSGGSLMKYIRADIGISTATTRIRYKDDVFDRIWLQWTMDGTTPVNTTSTQNFERDDNLFNMPPAVMSTGVVPSDPTQPLRFSWSTNNYSDMLYFYLSFAEIQNLKSNQTRELNIYLNGNFYFGPLVPPTKGYTTVYSKVPYTNGTLYNISLNKTQNSTLPPILNAVEVYRLKQFNDPQTDDNDVEAMFGIKSDYGVTKNWQGDPCSPLSDSWDGLKCSYTASNPPRITSMKLNASGLTGSISSHISNLTMIQILDLSNNKLTGPIPDFLGELPSLSVLNLRGNNFSGPVPEKLLQKSKEGNLALSIENVNSNTNICQNGSCDDNNKKKKNIVVPVLGSVASVLLLALAIFVILSVIKRRKQREPKQGSVESKKHDNLQTKNHRYSFAEIRDITNNFDKELGRGGFGKVYHGSIDGTQVAVKMLSSTSGQGFKEFQSEANVLMNVHHKNLTSLVGYCIEGTNIGIIYEFMANGNLHHHLSVSAGNHNVLSFRDRLQIAADSAQGQPAIIGKPPNHAHIIRWVTSTLNNGDIRDVVDPRLIGEFDVNSAWKVVELAMACVSQDSDKRPSMNEVVSELKDCLSTEMARHGTTSQRSINTLSAATIDLEFGPMAR
nr:brassinosteroid insensitive 1-associated receptor kinase 1 [Ipomoea trifida]